TELGPQLPLGPVDQPSEAGPLGQPEVASVVADVERLQHQSKLRAQPDIGEGQSDGVAPLEQLFEGQHLVLATHVVFENQLRRTQPELSADHQLDGVSAQVAVTVLEAHAKAFTRRKAALNVDVLRHA